MKILLKFLFKNHWKKILGIVLFSFTTVYCQLNIIGLISDISYLIKNNYYDYVGLLELDIFLSVAFAVVSLALVLYLSISVVRDFSYDLRSRMLNIVTDFDTIEELDKFPVSGLKTRFIRGVDTEESFLMYIFRKILLFVVITVEIVIALMFINKFLSIFFAIFSLISGIIFIFKLNRLSEDYFKVKALNGKLNRLYREKILSSKLLKLSSEEKKKDEDFEAAADNSYNDGFRFQYKLNFVFYLIVFIIFFIILFIFVSIYLIKIGDVDFIQMTLLLLYIIYLISNLNGMANFVAIYPLAYTSAVRIEEVLVCENSERHKYTDVKDRDFNGIEFENVSLNIKGKDILSDVSFKIPQNSKTLIVGPVGAGKSSLFYSLMGLYEVDGGKIFIDGYDASLTDVSKKATLTTTESNILKENVFENVRLGETLISDVDVKEALHDSLFDEFSDDLNYEINQNANDLSSDFKQRLAIARAIAYNRQYMIFDNSFSFIGSESKKAILNNLLEKSEDKTLIFIDNGFDDYIDFDNIIVLDEGHVVGQGNHDELIKNCKTYRKLYSQMKGDINGF